MSGDMIDYFNKHPQKLKEKQMRDKKKNMGKSAADSFAKQANAGKLYKVLPREIADNVTQLHPSAKSVAAPKADGFWGRTKQIVGGDRRHALHEMEGMTMGPQRPPDHKLPGSTVFEGPEGILSQEDFYSNLRNEQGAEAGKVLAARTGIATAGLGGGYAMLGGDKPNPQPQTRLAHDAAASFKQASFGKTLGKVTGYTDLGKGIEHATRAKEVRQMAGDRIGPDVQRHIDRSESAAVARGIRGGAKATATVGGTALAGNAMFGGNSQPQPQRQTRLAHDAATSFAKKAMMPGMGIQPPTPSGGPAGPANIQPPAMPQISTGTPGGAPTPNMNAAGIGKMASASFTKHANPGMARMFLDGMTPAGRHAAGIGAGTVGGAAAGGVAADPGNTMGGMAHGALLGGLGAHAGLGARRAMQAKPPPSAAGAAENAASMPSRGMGDRTQAEMPPVNAPPDARGVGDRTQVELPPVKGPPPGGGNQAPQQAAPQQAAPQQADPRQAGMHRPVAGPNYDVPGRPRQAGAHAPVQGPGAPVRTPAPRTPQALGAGAAKSHAAEVASGGAPAGAVNANPQRSWVGTPLPGRGHAAGGQPGGGAPAGAINASPQQLGRGAARSSLNEQAAAKLKAEEQAYATQSANWARNDRNAANFSRKPRQLPSSNSRVSGEQLFGHSTPGVTRTNQGAQRPLDPRQFQ